MSTYPRLLVRPLGRLLLGMAQDLWGGSLMTAWSAGDVRLKSEDKVLCAEGVRPDDGRPRLLLGLYGAPGGAALGQAFAAGFDLIQCRTDPAMLDRLRQTGAGAWISLGPDLDLTEDMVLQWFGGLDGEVNFLNSPSETGIVPQPGFKESRFMALTALLNGAHALMYWDNESIPTNSRRWFDLLRIASEVRALEPALLAPAMTRPELRVTVGERPVSTEARPPRDTLHVTLRWVEGEVVLFVQNESQEEEAFTIAGLPRELEGRRLYRIDSAGAQDSGESAGPVEVKLGGFKDSIPGEEVYIYATSRRFAPPRHSEWGKPEAAGDK